MKRQIWINRERVESAIHENVDGVELEVSLAPFNTPIEIVGQYLKSSGSFEIVFKYLSHEPPGRQESAGPISLVSGKHTGRLQRIVIPVDDPSLEHIGVIELRTKIANAMDVGMNSQNRLNRQFARKALEDKTVDPLFADLVAS